MNRRLSHDHHFDAWHECDLAPCGDRGALRWNCFFCEPSPPIDDCLAVLRQPWLLTVWEPLATKAPGPHLTRPHCCYIDSIIFYHAPYVKSPWVKLFQGSSGRWLRNASPGHFEEWDKIKHRFSWSDRVSFRGDVFEYGGGRVLWINEKNERRRWWMRHGFRRLQAREIAA